MRIYADNAATTPVSKAALDAMIPCLTDVYGNPSSLHTTGQRAAEKLMEAREIFARNLGAKPSEITFTSGGSEADNQALLSAGALGERKGKKHIISTAFEHHAVLHTLKKMEKMGFEVTLLEIPKSGVVTAQQVKEAIRPDTALVSVMFANNEIGTIQPVAEIGAVCREAGVLFHTDAVQAAGHLPIDVEKMNIDLLSLSAHKFHGPKGVGVLYARKGTPLVNVIEGGAQERGKRAGTENIPGICGAAAAFDEACANREKNAAKLIPLRDKLIRELSKIPHSVVNGDLTERLPGNVNMTALPLIETQAGDVSAYIPTNVISITDGQIYLETGLFFSGQRPAVNVGLSVSRVGGSAQTKAIKKTAGTLRIDLARFRELEVFNQFASDLDPATQRSLDHGKRMMELLKQPLYHPMPMSRQAVILFAATGGLVDDVPLEQVREFVQGFADEMESLHQDVTEEIQKTGAISDTAAETIRTTLGEYKRRLGLKSAAEEGR